MILQNVYLSDISKLFILKIDAFPYFPRLIPSVSICSLFFSLTNAQFKEIKEEEKKTTWSLHPSSHWCQSVSLNT